MFINVELTEQYLKISNLMDKAKEFEADDEIRSHLAKYLCVLSSGFIENAIYHVFSDIAHRSCVPSVALNFTKGQLFKLQNTNSEKIKEVTKSFNTSWWDNGLKDFMQDEGRGAAINYIFKDRHNIAHGRNSNITIDLLEVHLQKAINVISYLENQLELINEGNEEIV